MGFGRYVDGEYHLLVTFVRAVPPEEEEAWRYAFQIASNLLSRATYGQLRFGSVAFAPRALASREADAFIFANADGRAGSETNALGAAGFPMMLTRGALVRPMVIVHEFAHYALGLPDEYGAVRCVNRNTRACLMAVIRDTTEMADATLNVDLSKRPWEKKPWVAPDDTGVVRFFCGPADHVTKSGPDRSCWTSIVARIPGIVAPSGFEVPGAIELPWDPVRFRNVTPKQELRICIDAGADNVSYAAGFGLMKGLKLLRLLVQRLPSLCPTDQETDVDVFYAWNDREDTNPDDVIAGSFSDSDGLAKAIERIIPKHRVPPGDQQPAVRGMILISDGRTRGDQRRLKELVEECIAQRIRIIALGSGASVDHALLREIAERTGGRYERTLDDPESADVLIETEEFLVRAACDLIEDAGIVAYRRLMLPEATGAGQAPAPPSLKAQQSGCNTTIVVDPGLDRVLIVLLSRYAWALKLEIVGFDGEASPWVLEGESRHRAFLLATVAAGKRSPMPSVFMVRVTRNDEHRGPIEAIVMAITVNPDVHTAARVAPDVINGAPSILIKALRFSSPSYGDMPSDTEPDMLDPWAIPDHPPAAPSTEVSLRLDGVNRMFKTTIVPQKLEPFGDEGSELWYRPLPLYESALGALRPGVYPVTVEIMSHGGRLDFMRIHRFQLHVGPEGLQAQPGGYGVKREPDGAECPTRAPAPQRG